DETDNSGYVGLIEDNLENEIDIDNFGISGYRSDQLLKLIKEPDTQNSLKEADLVLMTIGANDMMKVFKRDFSHLKVEPFFNEDRKSTRLNSSHVSISYAVFCLKKKTIRDYSSTKSHID